MKTKGWTGSVRQTLRIRVNILSRYPLELLKHQSIYLCTKALIGAISGKLKHKNQHTQTHTNTYPNLDLFYHFHFKSCPYFYAF